MKVLHLTTHLNIGGITTHILNLSRGLKKAGIEPQVACSGGEMTEVFKENQIKTHLIPIKTKQEIDFKIFLSYLALKKLYQREKWDCIHAHTRISHWLAYFLSSRLRIPYFSTFHGFYRHHLGRKLFPCLGSHTLAISHPVEEDLKKHYSKALNRISTVHFGLDPDHYQAEAVSKTERDFLKQKIGLKNSPILGIIARLAIEKGHLELLDILSLLNKKRPVQLLIVGEGKQKKEVFEKIRALKLENAVFTLPTQKDPRVALSLIDIYVTFLSKAEGFGISFLEAMAMRKPVVVSGKVGGITDLVENGKNGFILADASLEWMAEKIEELIEYPELRSQMGNAAFQMVKEKFSYEKMGREVAEIYENSV